jgi:drug/metabolite transporter (DMT)-like permease
MPPRSGQSNIAWNIYALMTVAAWGVYGIFLQLGQMGMKDPALGGYKAFLFVGIAYFLTAVLAPLALLWMRGADWRFPAAGAWISLLAGIVGAIGAFAVLLAFGAGGQPAVVMTIVFAGAPIVNSVVGLLKDPPKNGWGSIHRFFHVGMASAIVGAALVTMYKPGLAHNSVQADVATWMTYSLMTVAAWGVYGIFLHMGQVGMKDPVLGRYKAFLFVGIAYFLTAVLAPLAVLGLKGCDWSLFTASGCWLSLVAGIVGAMGAFAVLLAFGAGGKPAIVMTIVFAGAPIVNAVVGLLKSPPPQGWGSIDLRFYAGIAMAIVGAALVTTFKPNQSHAGAKAAAAPAEKPPSPSGRGAGGEGDAGPSNPPPDGAGDHSRPVRMASETRA